MASADQVKVKGVGFEGVVAALKPSFEKSSELVPETLRHYMAATIDAAGWYPLPDYLALMKILASTIDPAKAKGDVYRAFGVIAAQRDVFGVQPNVPREQQPTAVATFQGALRGVTGLASLVKRALHLRERYYSHGYYTVKRVAERKLEVTLLEFPVSPELCAVSTGYLTHMMRSANVGAWVERISCCGNGDASCRWEIKFAEPTDVKDLAIFGGDSLPASKDDSGSLPARKGRKTADDSIRAKSRAAGSDSLPADRDRIGQSDSLPIAKDSKASDKLPARKDPYEVRHSVPARNDRPDRAESLPTTKDPQHAADGTPVWKRRRDA